MERSVSADGTAGAFRSLSGAARRSTRSERVAVIGGACLLLAAVLALGFLVSNPNEAVAVLYTLPIALVAVEAGAVRGNVGALVAGAPVRPLAADRHRPNRLARL